MLSKQQRLPLRQHPEFFRHSQRWFSPLFTVFWQSHQDHTLQGTVIVSKKTAAKAVQRNRLKRIFRHAIAQHANELSAFSLVISPKRNALSAAPQKIEAELQRFIQHVKHTRAH